MQTRLQTRQTRLQTRQIPTNITNTKHCINEPSNNSNNSNFFKQEDEDQKQQLIERMKTESCIPFVKNYISKMLSQWSTFKNPKLIWEVCEFMLSPEMQRGFNILKQLGFTAKDISNIYRHSGDNLTSKLESFVTPDNLDNINILISQGFSAKDIVKMIGNSGIYQVPKIIAEIANCKDMIIELLNTLSSSDIAQLFENCGRSKFTSCCKQIYNIRLIIPKLSGNNKQQFIYKLNQYMYNNPSAKIGEQQINNIHNLILCGKKRVTTKKNSSTVERLRLFEAVIVNPHNKKE